MDDEEDLDLSAGMVPHHHLGPVTGYDHDSGLPIVKREERGAEKPSEENTPAPAEETQEVGGKEPATGRDIVQPSDSPEQNQQLATEGLKEILLALKKIIAEIPGAKLEAVRPEKDPKRTGEKIQDEGKPAATVPDYSAVRVSVDSLEDNDKLVEAVRKQFPIAKEKNELEKGSAGEGFHAMMLQVQAPNKSTIEVQVLPKEVSDIAEDTHPDYVKARVGDKEAQASLKQQNQAAMEKFTARNQKQENPEPKADKPQPNTEPKTDGPKRFNKGDHVLLHDGRSATVDFHDHRMTGNARVTADDGERIQSIPGEKLTAVTSTKANENSPHVTVDLDGTLAQYGKFQGSTVIGAPIPAMVARVKEMLEKGEDVRIMTARVADDPHGKAARAIEAWCQKNLGQTLPITNVKDEHTKAMYDDKAVAVQKNTGKILGGENHEEHSSDSVQQVKKEGPTAAGDERSPVQSAQRPSSADAFKHALASRKPKEEEGELVQMKAPKGHTVVSQHFRKLPK